LLHDEDTPDYNLQISRTMLSDAGQYQCQINTQPTQSVRVNLIIIDNISGISNLVPALALSTGDNGDQGSRTRTEILAPDLVKMTEGGTVTLECVVTEHLLPPDKFIWHILGSPLDFLLHRGGIFLQNEKKTRSSSSKLTITKLQVADTGEYTCAPQGPGLQNKTVFLEVNQVVQRRSFHYVASETDGARDSRVTLLLLGLVSLTVILRL